MNAVIRWLSSVAGLYLVKRYEQEANYILYFFGSFESDGQSAQAYLDTQYMQGLRTSLHSYLYFCPV